MNNYVFFLGSNATLSAAEILTTLKRDEFEAEVVLANEELLIVKMENELPEKFLRGLGGVEKLAKVIDEKNEMWSADEVLDAITFTPSNSPSERGRVSPLPGKWRLGVSGVNIEARQLHKLAQDIKTSAQKKGSKVRFVTPKGRATELNAAQVLFNRLHEKPHRELIFMEIDNKYWLAETVDVQRIDEYELRDTQRPARDAKIGMLPPKLAQIMLNLVPDLSNNSPIIVDPFCGMGTVLQEGWLKKYQMVGSDIRDTMVESSVQNMDWLADNFEVSRSLRPELFTNDIQAQYPDDMWNSAEAIVTEPFLGKPLSTPLSKGEAEKFYEDVWPLYDALFRRGREILLPNGYIVTVLPALRVGSVESSHWMMFPSPFIDSLSKNGYSWRQLVPTVSLHEYIGTERGSVLYARPDALVGREITLWQRDV